MVDKLNIEDAHPPKDVKAAFDDVIKAKEDEERVKNEAEAYANQIVPEARGEAQRMIEEANAYKAEIVERAKGQANRFERLYVEYKMAPEVTRRRMYIDTMENVLSNTSKILVDVEGGNNLMYLPLDKLMQGRHDERSVVTEANTSQQSKTTTQKTSDTVRGLERIRQSRESRWENR